MSSTTEPKESKNEPREKKKDLLEISETLLPEMGDNSGNKLSLLISIDPGSTETRGIIQPFENWQTAMVTSCEVEPTVYYVGRPDEDYSHIAPLTDCIRDRLDFKFEDIDGSSVTILKGTMAKTISKTKTKTSSASSSKMEQESTVMNIHSFIVMLLLKFSVDNQIDLNNLDIDIYLSLALPSEDTKKSRINAICERLENMYEVSLPYLGNRHFTYNILRDRVFISSEVNSTAFSYLFNSKINNLDLSSLTKEQIQMTKLIDITNEIVVSAGGRSISRVGRVDGVFKFEEDEDMPLGGEQLYRIVAEQISEELSCNTISLKNARKALETGYIIEGMNVIDCVAEVNKAKKIFAEDLADSLISYWAMLGMSNIDLQRVVLSGRLFGVSKPNQELNVGIETPSVSLAEFIEQYLNTKYNCKPQILYYTEKYPIPAGTNLLRQAKNFDVCYATD